MSDILAKQLKQVKEADLSNYVAADNTYIIPKKTSIKLEENSVYILHLKETVFDNIILRDNWNKSSMPSSSYIKADLNRILNNMIKITGIELEEGSLKDTDKIWVGWLPIDSIEVLQKL